MAQWYNAYLHVQELKKEKKTPALPNRARLSQEYRDHSKTQCHTMNEDSMLHSTLFRDPGDWELQKFLSTSSPQLRQFVTTGDHVSKNL
jgi:hypothetical protein